MCLGNIFGDFSVNNMKKAELNWSVCEFAVDYRTFNTSNIIKYNEKTWYKKMFRLVKKIFIRLLTGFINGSNHTK